MPRKCKAHAGPGKPPKDCTGCQEAARLADSASAPAATVQEEAAVLLRRVEAALAPRQSTQPVPPPSRPKPIQQSTKVILFKPKAPIKPLPIKSNGGHASNGKGQKQPKPITPAMLRQRQQREARNVLREIELMGGADRCYHCPHAEEDHVLGECLRCWDERTMYHPFVSFLAGARRYFAELALTEGNLAEWALAKEETSLDESYEAAVS